MVNRLKSSFFILSLAACILATGCSRAEGTAKNESSMVPRPVRTQILAEPDKGTERILPGIARSAEETVLSFRVSGLIVTFTAETGKVVRKGDVIARMDDRDFTVRLRQAEARLAAAEARAKEAEQHFRRHEALFTKEAMAKAEFDKTTALYHTTQADLDDSRASLHEARNQLADTRLLAPFDGVIHEKYVENHHHVNAGQPIASLINPSAIEVMVGLPASMLGDVEKITGIRCQFASLHGRSFSAFIKEIGQQADKGSRTYPLLLTPEKPEEIRPGMTAEVRLHFAGAASYTLPMAALVPFPGDGAGIFVVKEGRVSLKPVQTGTLSSQGITVYGALQQGDIIVTGGASHLKEGQSVRIVPEPSSTNVGRQL